MPHTLKVTTSYYEDKSVEGETRFDLMTGETTHESVDVEPPEWMVRDYAVPGVEVPAAYRGILARDVANRLDEFGTTQYSGAPFTATSGWYSSPDGPRAATFAGDADYVEDTVTLVGFTSLEREMVDRELARVLRERALALASARLRGSNVPTA